MKHAWYILNYHDISWELSPLNFSIHGSFSPNLFREHLRYLSEEFEIISISDGINRVLDCKVNNPCLSFWFDDGFLGVRKNAFEILNENGYKAALSVNSNFIQRREMFWRFKLSLICNTDFKRVLRSRLSKFGYKLNHNLLDFTLDNFSKDILVQIDRTYKECTSEEYRKDSFRIFDTIKGLKFLIKNGWEIANHSASHYPVTEESAIRYFNDEFKICDNFISETLGFKSKFWVSPFDRIHKRSENLFSEFKKVNKKNKFLVLVGNKINKQIDNNVIYRIWVPDLDGKSLIKYLKNY